MQDGFTTAFVEWAEVGGTISISRKEERQNAGEGRLMNLLEAKIKQAEMTMREKLNNDLLAGTVLSSTFVPELSTGGNLGLLPLGYWLRKLNATDPTRGGYPGNIPSATHSWWRHHTADLQNQTITGNSFKANISTFAGLKQALYRMYNYCSRGSGGSPDLVVTDQLSFEFYNNALDANTRYTNTKMADMGFDTIKLRGATVIWDEKVPDIFTGTAAGESGFDGTAFFLNTNFYEVIYDSETNIITTPFVEPENQTAKTAKILFMGNSCITNLRKQGVCYNILQTISS